MNTREIPQDQWPQFFEECSQRHRGHPVTIEALGGALDAVQAKAFELPLVRITDERTDAGDHIAVLAGQNPEVRHVVQKPAQVRVYEQAGASLIEINHADGRSTRLRFGSCTAPMPPGDMC